MIMNNEQKIKLRKEIAKDVIAQLKAGKFTAYSTYGAISFNRSKEMKGSDQLQKFLRKTETCEVCGIGSLFISYVRKHNNVTLNELAYTTYAAPQHYLCEIDLSKEIIHKKLKKIFSTQELETIESAFEEDRDYYDIGPTDPDARLNVICKNIAKNGKFVKSQFIDGTFE